ncbi:MAG: hypothetical protein QNJ40_25735 [Xanthomonadales bacterium]|nr:hypothetical protein [Xanthomonadales bacterium]
MTVHAVPMAARVAKQYLKNCGLSEIGAGQTLGGQMVHRAEDRACLAELLHQLMNAQSSASKSKVTPIEEVSLNFGRVQPTYDTQRTPGVSSPLVLQCLKNSGMSEIGAIQVLRGQIVANVEDRAALYTLLTQSLDSVSPSGTTAERRKPSKPVIMGWDIAPNRKI